MSKRTENNQAVYQIVNERTLQFYIGSTKNFYERYGRVQDWTKHHNTSLRQDALAGDKFIYCKIQDCSSFAEAQCMEQLWFDFYIKNKLWNKLYNKNKSVLKFRCDITGRKATDEEKAKNSAAQKIAQNRPEVKAKCSIGLNCQATKEKRRLTNSNPEVIERKSKAQKIAQNKPERKAKSSISQKIAQNRPEVQAKRSGEASVTAKLTNSNVLEIRERYAVGNISMYALAKQYNICSSTVLDIVHYRTWKLI